MATISSVIPVLHNIADEEDTDSELTKDLKQKIIKSQHDRYGYGESFPPHTEIREVLEISTFSDPRFKTDYCTDDKSKRNLIDQVNSKAQSITAMITREEETSNVALLHQMATSNRLKKKIIEIFTEEYERQ